MATRSRVISITPESSAGALIVDSRAMFEGYAVPGAPHTLGVEGDEAGCVPGEADLT
jgi:hypothetical protein